MRSYHLFLRSQNMKALISDSIKTPCRAFALRINSQATDRRPDGRSRSRCTPYTQLFVVPMACFKPSRKSNQFICYEVAAMRLELAAIGLDRRHPGLLLPAAAAV